MIARVRFGLLLGLCACQVGTPTSADLAITTESHKRRVEDPRPQTSAIFDGAQVSLRGARGEVLTVLIDVSAPASMRFEGAPAALGIDAFVVEGVTVRHPSTAMYGPSRGAGVYPDRLSPEPGPVIASAAQALFDLQLTEQLLPGRYQFQLVVGARTLPVELVVEPPTIAMPIRAWGYYDAREVADLGAADAFGLRAGERACIAMFRAHGIAIGPDLALDEWPARAFQFDGLGYLPVKLPTEAAAVGEVVATWIARTQGSGLLPFAIPIDEPRHPDAWAHIARLARAARLAGSGPQTFWFAVTDIPRPAYVDVDLLLSAQAVSREGSRTPPRWTYNGTPPHAGAMIVDTHGTAPRTWGWIGWRWQVPVWYVWDVLYWHDRHNRRRRGEAIMEGPPVDASRDAATFVDASDRGNLDGVLALPPRLGEPATCIPTLRLKAIRRGFQDRALLDLLAACDLPRAEAIAASLVPRALADAPQGSKAAWPDDEAAWERARHAVLDALAACAAP